MLLLVLMSLVYIDNNGLFENFLFSESWLTFKNFMETVCII